MRPLVGSMSRLIIFIVVVLPQPEGPTSITISPAGISMVMLSTAGADFASYCLLTPSSKMRAPRDGCGPPGAAAESMVAESDTDPPRGCEPGEDVEHGVENDRQDQDPDGSRDHGVGGVGASHPRDSGEDVAAQTGPEGVRRDGRDTHEHLRRDPHPGHDDRP